MSTMVGVGGHESTHLYYFIPLFWVCINFITKTFKIKRKNNVYPTYHFLRRSSESIISVLKKKNSMTPFSQYSVQTFH